MTRLQGTSHFLLWLPATEWECSAHCTVPVRGPTLLKDWQRLLVCAGAAGVSGSLPHSEVRTAIPAHTPRDGETVQVSSTSPACRCWCREKPLLLQHLTATQLPAQPGKLQVRLGAKCASVL